MLLVIYETHVTAHILFLSLTLFTQPFASSISSGLYFSATLAMAPALMRMLALALEASLPIERLLLLLFLASSLFQAYLEKRSWNFGSIGGNFCDERGGSQWR